MKQKVIMSLVAASLSLLATTAFAENSEKCGCWYVGAGVGQSRATIDGIAPYAGATAQSNDDHDTGWKIFAGYQWNPNFAIEGGWVDLGSVNKTFSDPTGSASYDLDQQGVFLDAVGILPLNESFSLFAKAGGIYTDSSLGVTTSGTAVSTVGPDSDKNKLNFTAGLGAQYDFTRTFGVRAEWERYFNLGTKNSGNDDADLVSISAVFSFY
jgi:OOP family OmpA-OmpF porin